MERKTSFAEYIWLDGDRPIQKMRSKSKIIPYTAMDKASIDSFDEWGYDGSSTYQADGDNSDLILKPVFFTNDPIRGGDNYLVMCEVFNPDGTPHSTNTRANLREAMDKGGSKVDPWMGFEQEYTFFKGSTPLGWPESGYPAPQGPFYCSIGCDVAHGRSIVEDHLLACDAANLMIYGVNAEVMPGQWEFQMGYRGVESDQADPLSVCDHLWVARYLLNMLAEEYGIVVSLSNKPVKGDWNGAGLHTNFSTSQTRDPKSGMAAIEKSVTLLQKKHNEHIKAYGDGNEERLTGDHETCDINTFKSGVSNRGASIRIPLGVSKKGYGYFEDRRPGANANPYDVANMLVRTVCEVK